MNVYNLLNVLQYTRDMNVYNVLMFEGRGVNGGRGGKKGKSPWGKVFIGKVWFFSSAASAPRN
jgi:hypothetical protein